MTKKELFAEFDRLWSLIDDDRAAASNEVLAVVERARSELATPEGKLEPWEKQLLDLAASEAKARHFLNLAVVCIAKAYAVHDLPREEYQYGYNYGRRI